MNNKWLRSAFLLTIIFALIGCTPTGGDEPGDNDAPVNNDQTQTDNNADATDPSGDDGVSNDDGYIPGNVYVNEVQIMILESFPVQVHAAVSGDLANGCVEISAVESLFIDGDFIITISGRQPVGVMCTEALVPFSETVALDVAGLAAGTYTVTANESATASFTLDMANEIQADPFDACQFADPGQPSYANVADGYCVQHPLGFAIDAPVPGVLAISGPPLDSSMEPVQALLTIQVVGPAGGQTAAELAAAAMAEYDGTDIELTYSELTLSGLPATIIDGVPGRSLTRQAYVVFNDTLYVLTLSPVDPGFPQAAADVDVLWTTAADTLVFTDF